MSNHYYKKGFTLIELLVVIVIIAILSTIIIISYTGAQRKARDGKRKTDVQTIVSAYQIHYQETKTWTFSNAELLKVVPGTTATHEGSFATGTGWYNYANGSNYLISINDTLVGLGYMSSKVRDPGITSDTQLSNGDAKQYLKNNCAGGMGITVYAKLELPTDEEQADASLQCNATGIYGAVDKDGMNFGVSIK